MNEAENVAPSPKGSAIVVGFWRRFAADTLDAIVLAAVGWSIAYPFRYAISEMGSRAAWFGLGISLVYASVLQARFGHGQTVGKRLLGIQVLRRDGSYLTLPRSLARYAIVSFVFYNQMYGSLLELLSPKVVEMLGPAFLFAVFWAFLACFAMIPLHPLKRGLHDLVSDSIVVRKGSYDADALARLEDPRRAKRAIGLTVAAAAALLGVVLWGIANLTHDADMVALQTLRGELAKDYDVTKVNISTFNGANRTLTVSIWVPLRIQEDSAKCALARAAILARARTMVAKIGGVERVRVSITSGLRFGIANWNLNVTE